MTDCTGLNQVIMRPQAQAWREALEPTLHAFRAVRQGKLVRKEGNQFFWDLYRQTHVSWLTGITRTLKGNPGCEIFARGLLPSTMGTIY